MVVVVVAGVHCLQHPSHTHQAALRWKAIQVQTLWKSLRLSRSPRQSRPPESCQRQTGGMWSLWQHIWASRGAERAHEDPQEWVHTSHLLYLFCSKWTLTWIRFHLCFFRVVYLFRMYLSATHNIKLRFCDVIVVKSFHINYLHGLDPQCVFTSCVHLWQMFILLRKVFKSWQRCLFIKKDFQSANRRISFC